MKQALIVGAGGFVGSIARYLVGVAVARLLGAPVFPYATLVVNVVGCFVIGVLGGLTKGTLSPQVELLLITGMLGGMYVVPQARGHGIGAVLLDATLRQARSLDGVQDVSLAVTVGITVHAACTLRRASCRGVPSRATSTSTVNSSTSSG